MMNTARLLPIAQRIDLLLRRELGQGIEVRRTLREPLYARDVLLVCDAHAGTELARLAQRFRALGAEPFDERPAASAFGGDSSGFDGTGSGLPSDASAAARRKRWLSPGRWLGR